MSNINDLWHKYLRGEGYSGQVNDMMYQWLGDKGYTGSLNDRWMAALKADDVFGAAPAPPFTPDSLLTPGAAAYWSDPAAAGVKTQDVGRTTPAETLNNPVGSQLNQTIIGVGGNKEQATTSLKPLVDAEGNIKHTTNSQYHNYSGLALDLAEGITIAIRCKFTSTQTDHLFADQSGTATSLSLRGGYATTDEAPRSRILYTCGSELGYLSSNSIAGSVPMNEYVNLIFTADLSGAEVWGNGVPLQFSVTPVGTSQTTFTDLISNRATRSNTTFARGSRGREFVGAVSLRGEPEKIARLNAWLGGA